MGKNTMKFSNIWVAMAGVLIALGCVSCGSGVDGGAQSGTAPSTPVASITTDTEAIAAWYVQARQ